SVISGSAGNDMGIVVDDYIYAMRPIFPGSALYRGEAPSGKPYRYVKLKSKTSEIIENEPFERQPPDSAAALNEFYGRNWTIKEVLEFPTLPFPHGFNRLQSALHLHDEIPTIHVMADPEEVKRIHQYYLQNIAIEANVTYIRFVFGCTYVESM
ncbi:hypothetical protein K501DRAFT_204232, partial [Backusella circina FSU 941]